MADQPGKRQLFRFWHWARSQAPARRPAARAPPRIRPPSPTQPEPPSPPRSTKPPSPSRSPPAAQRQIPIRAPRQPSPSPRSSQEAQTSAQGPSPPSTEPSKQPPPTEEEASRPQKEAATQEVPIAPSSSPPPVSQPAEEPVEPQAPDSRPLPPTAVQPQPQPEPSSGPEAREQSLSEPRAPDSQTSAAGDQTTQVFEPETVSVDTVLGTTPTQNLILEKEPKEIKEEESVTSEEVKKEPPSVEEKAQMDTESKQPVEEKRQMGEELKIQTSEPPQVEGQSTTEPELVAQIRKGEEKPEEIVEEKPNTDLEVRKRTERGSPEPGTASEGNKNGEPQTKPEAQPAEKPTLPGVPEIKLSTAEADSEAPKPHPDTGELMTKPSSSVKRADPDDSKGRGSTMRRRTIPWASPSDKEQVKKIDEDFSKLFQKLQLGQSQLLGGESAAGVITLAGENQGATMLVGRETTKKESVLRTNKKAEASGGDKEIQKQALNHTASENPAIAAWINSNVQGINNSLLHESSCSEEDPGVHLVLSAKSKERAEPKETFRTAASTAPA